MFGGVVLCQQRRTAQTVPLLPHICPIAKFKHTSVFQGSKNLTGGSVSPSAISLFLVHKGKHVSPSKRDSLFLSIKIQ